MKERLSYLSNEQVLIILPTIFLLVIVGLIFKATIEYSRLVISNQKKREFIKIEMERKRIANDLHDYIANKLITIRRKLEDSMENIKLNEMTNSVEQVIEEIGIFHEDIRYVVEYIYPKELMNNDLSQSFFRLGEELSSTNTKIIVDCDLKIELNTDQSHQLFRITQEKLSNLIKHENPSIITLSLYFDQKPNEIILNIAYGYSGKINHRNANRLLSRSGRGLFIIDERMKLLGAKSRWEFRDGVFHDILFFKYIK